MLGRARRRPQAPLFQVTGTPLRVRDAIRVREASRTPLEPAIELEQGERSRLLINGQLPRIEDTTYVGLASRLTAHPCIAGGAYVSPPATVGR